MRRLRDGLVFGFFYGVDDTPNIGILVNCAYLIFLGSAYMIGMAKGIFGMCRTNERTTGMLQIYSCILHIAYARNALGRRLGRRACATAGFI